MNKVKTVTLNSPLFPASLVGIPDPPQQIHYLGDLESALEKPRLAIVGSRKVSAYGKSVTLKLAREAAEQGIVIVSGLALGVDGLAHQAALEAGGQTIAVLPSGLGKIYPATHHQLAQRIIEQGGALLSEYPDGVEAFKTNFVARNRIVTGISDAVLITEAALKSGSMHTANFARKQGKTLMTVPGNITSELSTGPNNLIKAGRAVTVTEIRDILSAMGLKRANKKSVVKLGSNDEETVILGLLTQGMSDVSELLHHSELETALFNQTLTMLEITGKIRSVGAGKWGVS
jgi:DNA processing protein